MSPTAVEGPYQPHLELSFYYPASYSFEHFVKDLIHLGAKVAGRAGAVGKAHFFNFPRSAFEDLLLSDLQLTSMWLFNLVGLTPPSRAERATWGYIPSEFVKEDHPPFAIYTEDSVFDESQGCVMLTPATKIAGRKVFKRFIEIINFTHPLYAAITGQALPLECPSELHAKNSSVAFQNFFVRKQYVGHENIIKIKKLYSEAYIQDLETGIYISTCLLFNPKHVGLPPQEPIAERSNKVARIIGNLHYKA